MAPERRLRTTYRGPKDLVRIVLPLVCLVGLSACTGPTQFTSALSDPGTSAIDPRLIGTWIGGSESEGSLTTLRSEDDKQLTIEWYPKIGEPALTLTGYAVQLGGKTYYNIKPEVASYFRAFSKANELPHYLLFSVEFINDEMVFVWTSFLAAKSSSSLKGKETSDDYYLIDASRDELRAALEHNPVKVLNTRIGPFFRLAARESARLTRWTLDERSGCLVGVAMRSRTPDRVVWSGDCREGRASGSGVVNWTDILRFEGTLVEGLPHGPGRCSRASGDWKPCRFAHGHEVEEK